MTPDKKTIKLWGTHNSFSYLPVEKWWMRPFNIFSKCQTKDIKEQIKDGARVIDIRLRFDKFGNPYFCHGLIKYYCSVYAAITVLCDTAERIDDTIFVRLIFEDTIYQRSEKQERQFIKFVKYFEYLATEYNNIELLDCYRKSDWKLLYKSKNHKVLLSQESNSNHTIKPNNTLLGYFIPLKWIENNIFLVNNAIYEKSKKNIYTLIDFYQDVLRYQT